MPSPQRKRSDAPQSSQSQTPTPRERSDAPEEPQPDHPTELPRTGRSAWTVGAASAAGHGAITPAGLRQPSQTRKYPRSPRSIAPCPAALAAPTVQAAPPRAKSEAPPPCRRMNPPREGGCPQLDSWLSHQRTRIPIPPAILSSLVVCIGPSRKEATEAEPLRV